MTELTRANRTYLRKVAPQVGDTFTVASTYLIKPVARRAYDGDVFYDDRYTYKGDRTADTHLDRLQRSGHLRLMQETKTRRFEERPLKKGGPDIYFEVQADVVRVFRRRK